MRTIDLNCDLGEGCGNDARLMKLISSANIACGYHAGDVESMRETVRLAIGNNVAIGAHPGYADRENFGRTPKKLSAAEIYQLIHEQLAALKSICDASDAKLHHVKPHGALYNQAAKDKKLAAAIAEAVRDYNPKLILYGLSGSFLISEATAVGLRAASEVFADRTYATDGTLTPRSQPDALIADEDEARAQALRMADEGIVIATDGTPVAIKAETICLHGDGTRAVEFAQSVRTAFDSKSIAIRSL